jgi:hypothetical protein
MVCGLAAGCSALDHGKRTPPPDDAVALRVASHHYLDVVIYVLHDGQRTRVGTATGSSSTTFSLPARLLGMGREIQLIGHPIGSQDTVTTETIVVQPGQRIEWLLESQLSRSTVAVY